MKNIFSYGLVVVMILMLSACEWGDTEVDSAESTVIQETALIETITEAATFAGQTITEVAIEPVFEDPLLKIGNHELIAEHTQLTVGRDITKEVFITVILEESEVMPNLLLVDRFNERVARVEGRDVTEEDVQSANLMAYTFTLKDLIPNHPYHYVIQAGDQWSKINSIELPSENTSTRVAIFGDLQGYKQSQYLTYQSVFDAAQAHGSVDLYFLMGDIVDRGETYEQWHFYYQAMADRGSSSIFATTIGNHDVKGSRDFYNTTFDYEKNGLEALPDTTGYFDLPFARVAMIDTEKPSTFDEQQSWLLEVMASSNKPYKIVLMHRSVYPIFYVEPHMQPWAEIFEGIGINLVLSGHDHIYSRTTVNDVTYVVAGSGSGSKFYSSDDQRPWEDVVYDEDKPVYILLDVSMSGLNIHSYGFEDGNSYIIDEVLLSETRGFD